jgi:hypothetical protein
VWTARHLAIREQCEAQATTAEQSAVVAEGEVAHV